MLEILTAIANIGTAIALYPLAKRYVPRAAIGYVAVRTLESTVIVAGIISVLSVLTLRQQFAGAGTDPDTLVIAGSFAVVAASGVLFDLYEPQSGPQMLLTFPEMIWELTFGLILIAKGFTAPARRRNAATASRRTAALA